MRDTKSGTLYVLGADIARRKPDRIIEDILSLQRARKYSKFGFEVNQFQSFLADELKRRSNAAGLYLPVLEVNHTSDKIGRIQSLQSLVRSGTLQLCRRHRTLIDQLRLFPKASHDDGPDALELAVHVAREVSKGPTLEEWKWCIEANKELLAMRLAQNPFLEVRRPMGGFFW